MFGLCIAFDFPGRFFDEECTITYDRRTFLIRNGTGPHTHSISATYQSDREFRETFKSAHHFLNELSWFNQMPISASLCVHGNGSPHCADISSMQHDNGNVLLIHAFRQQVQSNEAHLGLGFYREGLASNSPFYRFLSYFKVVELAYPNGNERAKWMSVRLGKLSESKASVSRLERSGVSDVGKWLYDEGRNALAHAGKESMTVRDICDYDHWQDIVWANEIVEELAIHLLITKFEVPPW